MNSEIIDWIEYNIEHDPESVNLMLGRLEYDDENLVESTDVVLYCQQYRDLLSNYTKALIACGKAAVKCLQTQET